MTTDVATAYNHWSGSYDQVDNPTRDLDARVTRELLAGRHHGRVLELGCGTGKNTAFLASLADHLVALDFSAGMLAQARRKVDAPHVAFQVADISRPWPFPDGSFGLMSCNLVLEHVQHLGPVFSEAARCLAPGGSLLVSELHPYKQYLGSQARFQHQGEELRIPAFLHHVGDYLSAAAESGLSLRRLDEWWDASGRSQPPRLLSLLLSR